MSGVLHIEIIVDSQSILAQFPSPSEDADQPTRVGETDCYVVSQATAVVWGQATAHLRLTSVSGQTIRVSAQTLTSNTDHGAVLYEIVPQVIVGAPKSATTALFAPMIVTREAPSPLLKGGRNTEPPTFDSIEIQDYFLEGQILRRGHGAYLARFYLTANANMNTSELNMLGYFEWPLTLTFQRLGEDEGEDA